MIAMRGCVAKKKTSNNTVRWYPVITVNGKRKWLRGYDTKKDAKDALQLKLAEIRTTGHREISKINFREFVAQWRELWAKLYLRQESTMATYESQLRILESKFGDHRMDEIDTIMIQELYAERLQNVDYQTARNTLSVLNSLFTVAIEWHHVNTNPMPILKKPKQKIEKLDEEDEGEVEIFTFPELQRFLRGLTKMWYGCNYRLVFLVLLYLGLRSSELFAVRWMDIDLETKQLRVRRKYYRGKFGLPKTKAGKRNVDIPDHILHELKQLKLSRAPRSQDLVFRNRNGEAIAYAAFYKSFKNTLKRLDIQSYAPHSLRHTNVSIRLREGQDHQYIIQQLGWENLSMLNVYAHLFRNDEAFRNEQRAKLNGFTLAKLASA